MRSRKAIHRRHNHQPVIYWRMRHRQMLRRYNASVASCIPTPAQMLELRDAITALGAAASSSISLSLLRQLTRDAQRWAEEINRLTDDEAQRRTHDE